MGATTYTWFRFGTRPPKSPDFPEDPPIPYHQDRSSAPPRRTNGRIGEDLDCAGCGHNLRGLDAGGNCPECGRPVRRSLEGVALDQGQRDGFAEGLRNLGKSALLTVAAPLAATAWFGPVAVLASMAGSWTRLSAARELAGIGVERGRCTATATAELGLGALVLAVRLAGGSILPDWAAGVLSAVLASLWIGTAVAGCVATWDLVDRAVAHHALNCERKGLPALLALGCVPALLIAAVARPLGGVAADWAAVLGTVAGAVAWGAACVYLASQATNAGDEIAAGPRRRQLRTPEDAPQPAHRARRPPRPDDDAPIPLD
jgi:hypothetical protein